MGRKCVPRAATGRRGVVRAAAAGGSMVMAGSALVAGNAEPAAAGHVLPYYLIHDEMIICRVNAAEQGNEPVGIEHGRSQIDATPQYRAFYSSGCNVAIRVNSYAEGWLGQAECNNYGFQPPSCYGYIVRLNRRVIDATPIPSQQWKKTSLHELGHVAGLDHRDTNNSVMTQGESPPVGVFFDSHDLAMFRTTYPRGEF